MHGGGLGVSGRMGENQVGLRTGWLAAFGTEGYEGEPPLMEELGVNFGHIKGKVCVSFFFFFPFCLSLFVWALFPIQERPFPRRISFSLVIIPIHPPPPHPPPPLPSSPFFPY